MAPMTWCPPAIQRSGSRPGWIESWPEGSRDGGNEAVETLEQIKARVEATVPGARLVIVPNDSPSGQRSVLVDREHALEVARFLKDDPQLRLDYASNVTGIDWPETVTKSRIK